MASYDEETKQRARDLYHKIGEFKALAELDEMPSRPTLHKWAKEGLQNGGVPWQESYEDIQEESEIVKKEKALQVEVENTRQFLKKSEVQIQNLIMNLLQDANDGKLDASVSDIKKMHELLMMIGETDEEVLDFVKIVVRRIAQVINSKAKVYFEDRATAKKFIKEVGYELREILNEERKKFITLKN